MWRRNEFFLLLFPKMNFSFFQSFEFFLSLSPVRAAAELSGFTDTNRPTDTHTLRMTDCFFSLCEFQSELDRCLHSRTQNLRFLFTSRSSHISLLFFFLLAFFQTWKFRIAFLICSIFFHLVDWSVLLGELPTLFSCKSQEEAFGECVILLFFKALAVFFSFLFPLNPWAILKKTEMEENL